MPSLTLHDSFLIREGRALGLDHHLARMALGIGCPVSALHSAYARMLREACASKEWTFPLLTFRDGVLEHLVRPINPGLLRTTAVLVSASGPDPRLQPSLKGPDFPVQTALRAQATALGADEAVLFAPGGTVREGVFSSTVHWDQSRLVISPHTHRLPSVTGAAVVHQAVASGVEVVQRASLPSEIVAADEVWCLSSLHGIRVVKSWDGRPVRNSGLAEGFRTRLKTQEQDARLWAEGLQDALKLRKNESEV
ncbi:aminotransferase class IV [Leucobacter sp. M11]|uniref:aminotransferase class IV n=1 Tax=Leucobacter sp. M11 TaxID=2993565 RepID=UPI003FA5306B